MSAHEERPLDTIQLPLDSVEGLQSFQSPSKLTPLEIKTESWCKRFSRWIPTSQLLLEQAETKILSYIKTAFDGKYVDCGPILKASKCFWSCKVNEERKIWTLCFNKSSNKTPLVLVHGLCASVGLWALNIDELAVGRPVYAIDLLGFGRSSRPTFSADPVEAENQHVEGIEAWRQQMKLDQFILLGHSMGGFISSAYALRYPEHVSHLVLADPWGIPEKPANVEEILPINKSLRLRAISSLGQKVNALSVVRAAGPAGPGIIGRVRPDLITKFSTLNQDGYASVSEYIYHCNAQKPSGEEAFRAMMDFFGWAKKPIATRIHNLPENTPMTMIYGKETWLQQLSEEEFRSIRPQNAQTKVHILEGAGHHVYADAQNEFNKIVTSICEKVDGTRNLHG